MDINPRKASGLLNIWEVKVGKGGQHNWITDDSFKARIRACYSCYRNTQRPDLDSSFSPVSILLIQFRQLSVSINCYVEYLLQKQVSASTGKSKNGILVGPKGAYEERYSSFFIPVFPFLYSCLIDFLTFRSSFPVVGISV